MPVETLVDRLPAGAETSSGAVHTHQPAADAAPDYRSAPGVTSFLDLPTQRDQGEDVSGSVTPEMPGAVPRSGVALAAVAAPERCPSVHKALRYYRGQYAKWLDKLGVPLEFRVRKPKACPRYLLNVTVDKARGAHKAYERWLERVTNDAIFAIRFVFGAYALQALVVADCESGLSRHAQNGQYLGIFQMGSYARSRYGHGETFLMQARAAYHYFVDSGRDWSPWSCKP